MENNFLQNLRTIQVPYKPGKEPAHLSPVARAFTSNKTKDWNFEMINDVLNARYAGNDNSENPLIDMNTEVPKTLNVRKIQTGRYKLNNNTNISGINDSNALYVVGNTYQENKDGTNYGMGWDGRPYSYTIKNDVVGNFTPLGIDEQRKAIERISDGKVKARPETVDNAGTLAEIYRSIKRMKEYGNGNLVPDEVNIGDPEPGVVWLFGGDGTQGWYIDKNQYDQLGTQPDEIALLGTTWPSVQAGKAANATKSGHNAGNVAHAGDSIPTHELAHAAESAYLFGDYRDRANNLKEAVKYDGLYSAEDLIEQGKDAASTVIGSAKYAIPILFDSLFGTHLVPTEEEYNEMPDGIASRFWADYIYPPKYEIEDIKSKKIREANEKFSEWNNEMLHDDELQSDLFKKAATNTGFDSVKDATASISQYATTNNTEAFAEAYTDVLLNGKNAKPFSQELIRLYSEAADKYTKRYKGKRSIQIDMLNELVDVLPISKADLSKPDFVRTLRRNKGM